MCVDVKDTHTGHLYPNGTYDGLIGLVQSNQISMPNQYFPYSIVFNEPGVMVQSLFPPFTPYIYSVKIKGESKLGLDVLYLCPNFSATIWFYWLISLTLFSIFCLILKHRKRVRRIRLRRAAKELLDTFWNYFLCFVDMAPSDVPLMAASIALWPTVVIAVFYGIHMVFMSTLSADLNSPGADKWIKDLFDLLDDPTFEKFRPTLFKQLNMIPVLSNSLEGSKERALLDRAIEYGSVESIHSVDSAMATLLNMAGEAANHTRAFVEDSFIVDILLEGVMCNLRPDEAMGFIKSSQPVYNYPTATILSHATHPDVVQLYKRRAMNAFELATVKGLMRVRFHPMFIEFLGIPRSIKGFICEDTISNILPEDMRDEWNPLPIDFFTRFIYICGSILIVAVIVLMVELLIHAITSDGKKRCKAVLIRGHSPVRLNVSRRRLIKIRTGNLF